MSVYYLVESLDHVRFFNSDFFSCSCVYQTPNNLFLKIEFKAKPIILSSLIEQIKIIKILCQFSQHNHINDKEILFMSIINNNNNQKIARHQYVIIYRKITDFIENAVEKRSEARTQSSLHFLNSRNRFKIIHYIPFKDPHTHT